MQYIADDEDNVFGFFSVDVDADKVAKKLGKLLEVSCDVVSGEDKYDDLPGFDKDTLIISNSLFTEELLELLDYGIMVYIIDY